MTGKVKAIVADKNNEKFQVAMRDIDYKALSSGDVTVAIEYSTVNYKDGLAISNAIPIVRKFPLILGIDLAGTVVDSDHNNFAKGDKVVVNGYGLSEVHSGGYAEQVRINGNFLLHLPTCFTTRQAMAIGTAGYTAMLSVMRLEEAGIKPGDGDVLVTGAAGGVGSVAISLLSKLGYRVVASTGRLSEEAFLKSLGASEVIERKILSEAGEPLQKERWAAAVDSVGSHTLANILAQTQYDGVVTACGLAQGADLPTTVMPFALRNVSLLGVDSVMAPMPRRVEAWKRLAQDLDIEKLESLAYEINFDEVLTASKQILAGEIRGRVIVNIASK